MSDPIQGFDVSVSVVGPNGPELVGEYKECKLNVKNETEEYLETNERIPRQLDGEIKIDGEMKRGWMNMNILTRIYGTSSMRRGEKVPASPRFTISFTVANTSKGQSGRLRVEQAVIPELSLSIKAGKSVVDKDLKFKAEGVSEA